MKPYYEQDGITIYHGDCREICPDLGVCADALITDPMYGVSTANISRKEGKTLRREFFKIDYVDAAVHQIAVGIHTLRQNAGALIYCGHAQFGEVNQVLVGNGFRTGPFCWIKTNPAPSVRKSIWRSCIELAAWGVRGQGFHWRTQNQAMNYWIGTACGNGHPEKNGHPTQKPTGAMLAAVSQLTQPDGTVIDTSMGSGTTLVVAKYLGRRAIGIELEERYCEIAANRLAQGVLFGASA